MRGERSGSLRLPDRDPATPSRLGRAEAAALARFFFVGVTDEDEDHQPDG